MPAPALARRFEEAPQRRAAGCPPERVARLACRHAELWRSCPADPPAELGPRSSAWRRWRNERAARRLIDRLAREADRYPEAEGERPGWRRGVRERVQRFGETHLGWPRGYRDLLFAEEFYDATVDFVREARAFDSGIDGDDLGQALRNVWIANSLQMLLGLPVVATSALFAYSMIYPYSDNLLDDPAVGAAAKRAFNRRLARRLEGLPVAAADRREARVFELVGRIEGDFSRRRFAGVFDSLLAIHRAQVRSLTQQEGSLDARALLAISVEKGGASVLADGYLAAGRLSATEEEFCFGYGVFLQLLDDLQDVETDLAAGHRTLYTHAARRGPLDRPTSRLVHFIDRVLADEGRFAGRRCAPVRDLIRRNCVFLLMGAVAEARERFSRPFLDHLERRWPFGFGAMRRLHRRADRRGRAAADRLRRRRGVDSLLELAT